MSLDLSQEEYIRERVQPKLRDPNYLSFLDLRGVVSKYAADVTGSVFDYGCGGAPYRSYFKNCQKYIGADIASGPKVDCVLQANGMTGQSSEAFDFILSSQVLEHVQEPARYLTECHRILKPGGRVLLTTHGMFQEHGCPYDFYRWTSRGLEELISTCHFQVLDSFKLTADMRGIIQLTHHFVEHLRCPGKPFLHYPLAAFRKTYNCMLIPVFNLLGRRFPQQAVVPANSSSSVYVGIGVLAEKQM